MKRIVSDPCVRSGFRQGFTISAPIFLVAGKLSSPLLVCPIVSLGTGLFLGSRYEHTEGDGFPTGFGGACSITLNSFLLTLSSSTEFEGWHKVVSSTFVSGLIGTVIGVVWQKIKRFNSGAHYALPFGLVRGFAYSAIGFLLACKGFSFSPLLACPIVSFGITCFFGGRYEWEWGGWETGLCAIFPITLNSFALMFLVSNKEFEGWPWVVPATFLSGCIGTFLGWTFNEYFSGLHDFLKKYNL